MKLEEYIFKRKKEDGINEYDISNRAENTRICVNYIFEYFNNYLETTAADEKTLLQEEKIDKYRHLLREYDAEVREWLVSLYASYGKYMHRNLSAFITDTYFLLYDSEAEFRALSYKVYSNAIKRFDFLDGHSEMIYLFIKDYFKIESSFSSYNQGFAISESIDEWIYNTYRKVGVNIYRFCDEWAHYLYNYPDKWPKAHKKRSEYYYGKKDSDSLKDSVFWDYDYRQKNNLFGLDSLYRDMPKKPFVKGKKQEFEVVLMYCWLHSVTSDDDYWEEYKGKVLDGLGDRR
ncbi:hypothetical protein SDC9_56941 [bioreactor metagenome]|uniref:Uncharacterized protein n=1 Tax=bioreactor metagenome TaxID=1076179 RepID=A0A644X3F8_9ZZZZ